MLEYGHGGFFMNYTLIGDSDNPLAQVSLSRNEVIKLEPGAMVFMQDVELEGKTNSKSKGLGGLLKAAARSVTSGESFFMTHATGQSDQAVIGLAPGIPGKIVRLVIDSGHQYRLNTGVFLACDESVNYNMKSQDLGKAFFGGTGGLFVMETEGTGDILVNAFGDLLELDVQSNRPLTIDNEHVVAWDATLDYNIRVASGMFGFTTGEGLVNEFHGNGKVYIQTRNIHSLASAVQPFIQTTSNQ